MKVRVHVTVQGRVQGVAFRNYAQAMAQRLDVSGWVRNLSIGDVEGCFEGEDHAVSELVKWCRTGPPAARVDNLVVREGIYSGEFAGFSIRF